MKPDLSVFLSEYRQDTAGGDRTSLSIIPRDATITSSIRARQAMTIAGTELVARLPAALDLNISTDLLCDDAMQVADGTVIAALSGSAIDLLGLERTLLNGLQILCGIATETRRWVDVLPDNVTLLDTRKTHPLLRDWERLAVRCGGGKNHRYNLSDTIMIKDNHLDIAGNLSECVRNAVRGAHGVKVICEVENLDAAIQAVHEGASGLLIDNQPPDQWHMYWDAISDATTLEFSGGITFEMLSSIPKPPRPIFVSSSKPVMAAPAVDIGLDITTD